MTIRKRIAFVSNQARTTLLFRGSLIRALTAEGHEVHVLVPDADRRHEEGLREVGATTHRIALSRAGVSPRDWLREAASIGTCLRDIKADVAFAFFLKPIVATGLAVRFWHPCRYIAMVEGLGHTFQGDSSRLLPLLRTIAAKAALRAGLSPAERVLFLNDDDLSYFTTSGICSATRTTLTGPIGVDLSYFSPPADIQTRVSFAMVARLLREKGVLEYFKAAAIVRTRYPDAVFKLIGDVDENPGGISREHLQHLLAEGHVEWTGYIDDVRNALRGANVFVLPSYREGYPRSTQEAMAMGLAVVTTDVPGCRDTVVAGSNGLLVPARDAHALADALESMCSDPARVKHMGKMSRHIAEERYDSIRADAILSGIILG